MVKVADMIFPPEYEPLLKKILAWFDTQIYPTWATRFFHTSRGAKKELAEKTYVPKATDYWKELSSAEKAVWKSTRFQTYLSSYSVFFADFSYRNKFGFTLPGVGNALYQVYGLKMANVGGLEPQLIQYHAKDLVGRLTISFNYKKNEITSAPAYSFGVHVDMYYFEKGLIENDSEDYVSADGNLDWTSFSATMGHAGRKYFHVVITLYLYYYDAEVFIDNFLLEDANDEVERECWKVGTNLVWNYSPLYRKQGWDFYPAFGDPYFKVLYLAN